MVSFHLIESHYLDDGSIKICWFGSIQAEKRPDGEKVSTSEMDIWRDWVDSRAAADRLVEAAHDFEPVPLRRLT